MSHDLSAICTAYSTFLFVFFYIINIENMNCVSNDFSDEIKRLLSLHTLLH